MDGNGQRWKSRNLQMSVLTQTTDSGSGADTHVLGRIGCVSTAHYTHKHMLNAHETTQPSDRRLLKNKELFYAEESDQHKSVDEQLSDLTSYSRNFTG
eukprot:gene2647-5549_t